MNTLSIRRALYLLPGIIVILAILASNPERFSAMRNDFLQFFVSAHLLGTPGFYNEEANRILRDAVAPNAHIVFFPCRPPFQTMLLWPLLRWLPLYWAFAFFQLLSLACLILFTRLFSARCPSLPVYVSLSVPVAICLMNGQDIFLVLLAVGVGILLAEKNRDLAAGLVLSLCAIKFHLFLFLPVMLLLQKRWRILGGLAGGSFALLIASFLVQGWRWPLDLLAVLRKPELSPFVELMPNLHGLWYRLGVDSLALELASSLCVALLVILASRNVDIGQGMSVVLVGGLLTSYHAYLYDPILLLLPLVFLPGRNLWIALCVPPLYCLAVMDGIPGTIGIGGLVVAMVAGLTWMVLPEAFRAFSPNPKPQAA
jgi:hypothetical protein